MLKEKIEAINESIQRVCSEEGLDVDSVNILAATKTVDVERINLLPSLGITLAGENRVKEFVDKKDYVRGITWHFIGALQTNKAKFVVGNVDLIHSVDRTSLVDEIERLSEKKNIISDILLEVNVGGEENKSGISQDGFDELYDYCGEKTHIRVRGLMSVLPIGAPERMYERLYEMYAKKKEGDFDTLSVGMSGDYLTAIKHGANLVRLGSMIFGKRN
ncbi:MAG: YggS family pyridoxal phosphate-dependent enzyme [Clostridia bacterium]|nr:YggS family pyridoxal phosphate-dependent enzyme [Clostridia bacterium]